MSLLDLYTDLVEALLEEHPGLEVPTTAEVRQQASRATQRARDGPPVGTDNGVAARGEVAAPPVAPGKTGPRDDVAALPRTRPGRQDKH